MLLGTRRKHFEVRRIRSNELNSDFVGSEVEIFVPSAVTKHAEINAAIQRVGHLVGPDVVRIRYQIGEDWSGQWPIFFRVVLTDEAARRRLREVAMKVVWEAAMGRSSTTLLPL
jgi:hypothetical protein